MEIKAIHLFENGFISQPFAFGGEDGKEAFDNQLYYRSSLQNFAIDTGDEVILVDTGLDGGLALPPKEYGTPLYMGERLGSYMERLAAAGIDPARVTKILVTHKHADHTDELKRFPNAEIFIAPEDTLTLAPQLAGFKVNKCQFTDGPYYEFERSQTIVPGVHYIFAPGHTRGNSIVVVEKDGLFYMLAGDVTYCDAALKANKFSTATDDKDAARDTLNRVRAFINARPTVYLTSHCPEGYESLELKRVMKLDDAVPAAPAEKHSFDYYGKVKGTALEGLVAQLAAGEAMGGGMYYALSRIASSFGLDDVAAKFVELGNQETNHAGFYATLGGKYPNDKAAFWKLVAGLSKAEYKGDVNIGAIAQKLDDLGLKDAAAEARVYAAQELHHGEVTKAILEKYAPEFTEAKPGVKKFVCPVCGFEYEGDLAAEPDAWKCPICGVPKASFKPQE